MTKVIDWDATKARAENMSGPSLWAAYLDCVKTAEVWDINPEADADGNGGYYRDEASVYHREMTRRRTA